MAEYVVERSSFKFDYKGKTVTVERPINYKEEVIRCRDCKYYENKKFIDYNDNEYEHLCWYFADYENTPPKVEPDGFCAWGEKR